MILVNINPAYRTHELRVRARAVGLPRARRRRPSSRRATTWRWSPRSRPSLPALERGRVPRHADWDDAARAPATRSDVDALRARVGDARLRRPDQHPVHERHHRLPEGRDAQPPQHPEQRLLRRRGAAATPSATACASPCPSTTASGWCSATSRARATAPRSWCPAPAFDPRRHARDRRGRALHQPLRRADDVHRRARASATSTRFDLSSLRTGIMAGVAVPGRGDEAVHLDDAHGAR